MYSETHTSYALVIQINPAVTAVGAILDKC